MEAAIDEIKDRERRANNLIITGLKASNQSDHQERVKDDIEIVKKLCQSLNLNYVEIT